MFTGVQRPVLKFSEICTFSVLYKAYLAARRGKRSRAATANYEVHLLANIVNLVYILQTKIYRPGLFRVFYVYEPKKRLVQAPAFVDKVVQHALVDNLIYERITNSFILDNYASQKGKGLHFGLDRLRGFFTEYWNKYRTAEGWVLKADVRHFFASIDHDKLRRWEQDYPAGLVTREKILQSWQAWDAHAAHGNTWSLRQQVRDRVQNILKEEI